VTTSNYSAIVSSHTLLFTTARTKSFQFPVFTGCRLVTVPSALDSSASVFHSSGTRWLSPVSHLILCSYATAYNSGCSHAATRRPSQTRHLADCLPPNSTRQTPQSQDWVSSVGRLNFCWSSPAESFLASVSSISMSKIFILS
jgi:hypothetical protein